MLSICGLQSGWHGHNSYATTMPPARRSRMLHLAPCCNSQPLAIPRALQHEPNQLNAGRKENNQHRFLARSAVAAAVTS